MQAVFLDGIADEISHQKGLGRSLRVSGGSDFRMWGGLYPDECATAGFDR